MPMCQTGDQEDAFKNEGYLGINKALLLRLSWENKPASPGKISLVDSKFSGALFVPRQEQLRLSLTQR